MFFFARLYQSLSKEKSQKPLRFLAFLENSALGELRRAASCLQAVLLSFLHSRVTGQEASGFQRGTELGVDAQQSAGNAMTDGAGLAGNARLSNE